jgi:hypothetical protein
MQILKTLSASAFLLLATSLAHADAKASIPGYQLCLSNGDDDGMIIPGATDQSLPDVNRFIGLAERNDQTRFSLLPEFGTGVVLEENGKKTEYIFRRNHLFACELDAARPNRVGSNKVDVMYILEAGSSKAAYSLNYDDGKSMTCYSQWSCTDLGFSTAGREWCLTDEGVRNYRNTHPDCSDSEMADSVPVDSDKTIRCSVLDSISPELDAKLSAKVLPAIQEQNFVSALNQALTEPGTFVRDDLRSNAVELLKYCALASPNLQGASQDLTSQLFQIYPLAAGQADPRITHCQGDCGGLN